MRIALDALEREFHKRLRVADVWVLTCKNATYKLADIPIWRRSTSLSWNIRRAVHRASGVMVMIEPDQQRGKHNYYRH